MSTQEKSGPLYRLLERSWVYESFQRLVGSSAAREWVLDHLVRPEPGMTVVDVGCGPGRFGRQLPERIQYYGFDTNEDYIRKARSEAAAETHYIAGDVRAFMAEWGGRLEGQADLVTCSGVLHHLSDEETDAVLAAARRLLKPTGRFAGIEPSFLRVQRRLERYLVGRDRGDHVRSDVEWRRLFERHFPVVETAVLTGLLRIPYTHIAIEASPATRSPEAP